MNVWPSVIITPLFFALLVEIKVSSLHSSVQRAANRDGGYMILRGTLAVVIEPGVPSGWGDDALVRHAAWLYFALGILAEKIPLSKQKDKKHLVYQILCCTCEVGARPRSEHDKCG